MTGKITAIKRRERYTLDHLDLFPGALVAFDHLDPEHSQPFIITRVGEGGLTRSYEHAHLDSNLENELYLIDNRAVDLHGDYWKLKIDRKILSLWPLTEKRGISVSHLCSRVYIFDSAYVGGNEIINALKDDPSKRGFEKYIRLLFEEGFDKLTKEAKG